MKSAQLHLLSTTLTCLIARLECLEVNIETPKCVCRDSATIFDDAQQHVCGIDGRRSSVLGFVICQRHYVAGSIGETFVHC